jgi:hypothetical protein
MLHFFKPTLLLLAIPILFLAACSNDNGPSGPDNEPPEIPILEFVGPDTESQDEGYYQVHGFVAMINARSQMGWVYMSLPAVQDDEGGWTWTLAYGGITTTLSARYSNDGSITWKLIYSGSDGFETYNNWTAFEGTSGQDGSSGSIVFYNVNTTVPAIRSDWNVDGTGTKTAQYITYAGQSGTPDSRATLVNGSNGAGTFILENYANGSYWLNFDSEWNAAGAGWWKNYDTYGELINEGTWV